LQDSINISEVQNNNYNNRLFNFFPNFPPKTFPFAPRFIRRRP